MAGLKVKIGADASQFERTMRGVKKQVGGVKSSILGIAGAVGAIYAVNKAFDAMRSAARLALEEIKASSAAAASVEDMAMQFETLLGSADAAQVRLKDLVEFATSTPFEIQKLSETSAMLQGMTDGALATGKGLRMVGDAAAAVNKPLEVVGMNVGKLFQGLTQGGEVAEAANQLMQYGLVSGEVKIRMQNFVKEAKAGERAFMTQGEALEELRGIFGKTGGAMERLATTTNGKISMMKDAVFNLRTAFGKGFNEGLKDALDATTRFLPKLTDAMTEAGEIIGTSISEAVRGDLRMFQLIGDMIGSAIAMGVKAAAKRGAGEVAGFFAQGLEGLPGVPEGISRDIRRGNKMETARDIKNMERNFQMQMRQMNRLRSDAELRKRAQQEAGMFAPMIGQGAAGSQQLDDIKEMRTLVRQILGRVSTLSNPNPFAY